MASQRPESGDVAVDNLESTAKLPVLEVAAIDELDVEDESHLRTTVLPPDAFSTSDTHPGIPILSIPGGMQPPGYADAAARVVVRAGLSAPAGAAGAPGDDARAVEAEAAVAQLLESQADLLREIREVREEADARYVRLESDLDDARRLGEDLDAMRREAEARSLAAEQRCTALEAEFAAARAQLVAEAATAEAAMRRRLEDESSALRGQLEAALLAARRQADADTAALQQRDGELVALRQQHAAESLAGREAHDGELAALRQQHAGALAALRGQLESGHESTRRELGAELLAAREQAAVRAEAQETALRAARAETAELGRALAELRGLKTLDETALAQRGEEIARLGQALDDQRAKLAEAGRGAEQSLAEHTRELELLRAELVEVRALAALRTEALQAAESRRGIWASLLGDAESEHDAQLREARETAGAERARAAATEAELATRLRRHGELEAALRAELDTAAQRAQGAEARVEELLAALAQTQATLAQAEGRLEVARAEAGSTAGRLAGLEERLEVLQSRSDAADAAARDGLEALRAERDALQARNATLDEALGRAAAAPSQAAIDEQAEALRTLQAELRRGPERVAELESDLRAAEDQVNRLEGELRIKTIRLEELARTARSADVPSEAAPGGSRRRDEFAARGRGVADAGTTGDSLLPADSAFSGAGAAATADGVTRYFVLMDGDTEIVHVLGRRTTIGRGLDNDVRLDTKFISRHHAVVLAGPQQTVVEDLRSTNGVLVNGRRVTRSTLRDGDIVHVGKTKFRFVQRHRER